MVIEGKRLNVPHVEKSLHGMIRTKFYFSSYIYVIHQKLAGYRESNQPSSFCLCFEFENLI